MEALKGIDSCFDNLGVIKLHCQWDVRVLNFYLYNFPKQIHGKKRKFHVLLL